MNIEELTKICQKYPGVTTDIKWGDQLCFNIGGKMFLITSLTKIPTTASFKVSDEDFNNLIEKAGFKPAPYLARYKWVFIEDITLLTSEDWTRYSRKAYELISSRLPKKVRKELGLNI